MRRERDAGPAPNSLEADLAAFNVTIEAIPGEVDPRQPAREDEEISGWENEDGDYLIWPENWPTWICFLELADQWEIIGGQGMYYQGIPVERIDSVLRRARMTPEDEATAWDDLKAMAATAKPALNQKLREASAKP